MLQLDGKKILVTGGSKGIGAGIAEYLAEAGACVGITFSSNENLALETLQKLKKQNSAEPGHFSVHMDVRDPASVEKAFKFCLEKFEVLDGLVNNAGITKDQLLLRMSPEDFKSVLDTNLMGTFLCSKAALRPMMKAHGGSIVNITSVIGQTGNPGQANYAASKAGIEAFSKSMAKEMGSRGIRVNCVAPGFIITDMTHNLAEAQKNAILQSTSLGRMGRPRDIAAAVAFLLGDESSYITGQTLNVNGGMYM